MKRIILYFVTASLLCGMTFAQTQYAGSIHHPVNPQIGQPRIMADTIFVKHTWGDDTNPNELPGEPSAIIKRCEDGLRDTFYYRGYTNEIRVLEYDTNNRLISVQIKNELMDFFDVRAEYVYDSSGRLTELSEWSLPGDFENYDYSTIVYTDSSYVLNQIEYVFDSEDRLIRAGEVRYSYFEDGYEEILGSYEKMTYIFLANGYLSKRTFYQKQHENGEWFLKETWETTYRYTSDNPNNPNGNTTIETTSRKAYGVNGAVMIQSDKMEKVRIYAVSGLLIRELQTSPGNQSIALSKGFYIVLIEDKAYKVMVR